MVAKKVITAVQKSATVSVKVAATRNAGKPAIAAAKPPKAMLAAAAVKAVVKKPLAAIVKSTQAPAQQKSDMSAADKKTVTVKTEAAAMKNATAEKVRAAGPGSAAGAQQAAQPTPEERYRMVQTAAYFIAEHHGFAGCAADHWAAAEREIAAKLAK